MCAEECPGKGGKKALEMVDVNEELENEVLADYMFKDLEPKTTYYPTNTIKGSQFLKPYFEVSGACPGCGEAPYYKLVSQLFGRDMLVANATGCSMIYCSSAPSTPFVKDKNGEGVAWANSLFEDNAEFGFGEVLNLWLNSLTFYRNLKTVLVWLVNWPVKASMKYPACLNMKMGLALPAYSVL